jgi:hypothetical protein
VGGSCVGGEGDGEGKVGKGANGRVVERGCGDGDVENASGEVK